MENLILKELKTLKEDNYKIFNTKIKGKQKSFK